MCSWYPMGGEKQVSNFSVQATAVKLSASVPHANMCCMQMGIMKDTSLLLVRGRCIVNTLVDVSPATENSYTKGNV